MELWYLFSAHRLIVLFICIKFRESILKGFRVIERTRFVTDRQTDNYEKIYMSPPDGGDIIIQYK